LLPHSVRAISNRICSALRHSFCPFQYYRIIMHLRFYRREKNILMKQNELWGSGTVGCDTVLLGGGGGGTKKIKKKQRN